MTKASISVVKLIDKLDGLKSYLRTIDNISSTVAFPDNDFSIFPLYYLVDSISGDIHDMEPESISLLFGRSDFNATKVNAMTAVLKSTAAWTNIFAFNTAVEASNSLEIQADSVVPYSATEILWGMINIASIDSALTLPFKGDVLAYIKASLDDDGWDIPPLALMFQNITDLYDDQNSIEEAKSIFGELGIGDLVNLESIDHLQIGDRPDLQNYIIRNQEFAVDISQKYQKLMFDWTTIINGG